MPQMIVPVSAIPYTKNGKKCEVAVKKLLRGDTSGVQPATLLQADALTDYEAFSEQLLTTG